MPFLIVVVFLSALALSGCATQAAKTGFIEDYSKLEPHPEVDGRHRYINPHVDAAKYSKFIVEPVAINLSAKGKDLGPDTPTIAQAISEFNLDNTWTEVQDW